MTIESNASSNIETLMAAGQCLQNAVESLSKESSSRGYTLQSLNASQDMICIVANDKAAFQNQALFFDILKDVYDSIRCCKEAVEDLDSRMSVSFCSSASSDTKQQPGADRSHIASLQRQVSADKGLASVAGLAHAKQSLMEAVVLPMRYRHLFTGKYTVSG